MPLLRHSKLAGVPWMSGPPPWLQLTAGSVGLPLSVCQVKCQISGKLAPHPNVIPLRPCTNPAFVGENFSISMLAWCVVEQSGGARASARAWTVGGEHATAAAPLAPQAPAGVKQGAAAPRASAFLIPLQAAAEAC
eukprot:scaffold75221_cov16-Tisochrysis_lutea.AAC.2